MGADVKKIIIETDPGIDDAAAIFLALQSPEVDVIGLTTIYGNVYTTLATRNALHLVAGRTDIPVAEGSHVTFTAVQLDSEFTKNVGQIVLLGGAFSVNGNVNPAAEANEKDGYLDETWQSFGDPEATDIVFTCGADVVAIRINVTHQVVLSAADRERLSQSKGKFAQYLCQIRVSTSRIMTKLMAPKGILGDVPGVYLHDPTALLAAMDASLFTYVEGVVRVQTLGIMRGLPMFDNTNKWYGESTEWTNKPPVKVAVTVDAPAIVKLLMDRLMNSEAQTKSICGIAKRREL